MPNYLEPPAGATRMLSCFGDPAVPQILGDLMEEFRERVDSGGTRQARRWYWREAFRNAFVLIRRKPAVSATLAGLLCFLLIHLAMTVVADIEWRLWALRFVTTHGNVTAEWLGRYRIGWYGWSWKLAFPPDTPFALELLLGLATGLLSGGIFASLSRERVQAFRIATISCWLLFAAVFFVRSTFFISFDPRWHGDPLHMVRGLLLNFTIREFFCAGGFWLGTYLPALRRGSLTRA